MSPYQTWRFDSDLSHKERSAFSVAAAADGIRSQMCSNSRFASTYVLLELPQGASLAELAARYPAAVRHDTAIIALGIEPEAEDALPVLLDALGGRGAPLGVTRAEVRKNTLLLEFSPERTSWGTVKALIDAELRRFGSATRHTTLLAPLSLEMEAQIAADGLECAELQTSRVLEALTNDHADR